jgi:hypothetical protein
MIKVRAKTVIKLDTGKSSLDYVYLAGTSVEELAKDTLHAVVQNKGTVQAKLFVDGILGRYDPDYRGFNTSVQPPAHDGQE